MPTQQICQMTPSKYVGMCGTTDQAKKKRGELREIELTTTGEILEIK